LIWRARSDEIADGWTMVIGEASSIMRLHDRMPAVPGPLTTRAA
jgi:hypothetical protein